MVEPPFFTDRADEVARPSGSAANAARRLAEAGYLTKPARRGSGFAFDSSFLRGWVVVNALPDLGLHIDPLERGVGGPERVQ